MNKLPAIAAFLLLLLAGNLPAQDSTNVPLLETEKLPGRDVWIDPRIDDQGSRRFLFAAWFEDQLLGDGAAYARRTEAPSIAALGRRELRRRTIHTLKALSQASHTRARTQLEALVEEGDLTALSRHWIVNGFSGVTSRKGVEELAKVPGVRKIFFAAPERRSPPGARSPRSNTSPFPESNREPFTAGRYAAPWYVEKLGVDRVWEELGITGKGVLNIVNDGNFALSENILANIYTNEAEPWNGKDDDGNGLIDDRHGYDFGRETPHLTPMSRAPGGRPGAQLHGHQCAAIICGTGTGTPRRSSSNQLGIAPESQWAGVITGQHIEAAVEWAIEHSADTYSMSFSRPGLGEYRSHWRKIFEHGAFCGVHFVSGAGNYAQEGSPQYAPVPVQMRTPEDIPHVVFAAAGVQRDLSRTPFSSQGPVEWNLEHYQDGQVDKPEVCAFNFRLPQLLPDGEIVDGRSSGNSFAGPMFCGTIALMLSANPDLKPWEVRRIIIDTARDVGPEGFDFQTGHGLIDAFAAVQRVLESLPATGASGAR